MGAVSQLGRLRAGIVDALNDADIGLEVVGYVPTAELAGATVFVALVSDETLATDFGATRVELDVVLWVPNSDDETGQARVDELVVGPLSIRSALAHDLTFGGAAVDGSIERQAQASSADLGGQSGWSYVWRLSATLTNGGVQ